MNVPIFEIKDSFIIKNILNYNTTLSGDTYGILFTDYDLARKTQNKNAERFDNIIINTDLSDKNNFILNYKDDNFNILLDNEVIDYNDCIMYPYQINDSGYTFVNDSKHQEISVDDLSDYDVDDYLEISFYLEYNRSGETTWTHSGETGETWYVNGFTDNNVYWNITSNIPNSGVSDTINSVMWEVTGSTISSGQTTGTTNWEIIQIIPILKYKCYVIGKNNGSYRIKIEKKLENWLFNNLSKVPNLKYKILNINKCNKNYLDISNHIKKSPYGNYISCNVIDDVLTLTPIRNDLDLYFDYNIFNIDIIGSTTTNYTFNTNYLYNKYTLELFLDQFFSGSSSGETIYYNYSGETTSNQYEINDKNSNRFKLTVNNIDDLEYFKNYTYIYITTNNYNTYRALIVDINEDQITIIPPLNMILNESIIEIKNLYTVKEISDVLYECYVNINNLYSNDYSKLNIDLRRYVYNSYYEIINNLVINENLRNELTGALFENINNTFVLKIYNPQDIKDNRLTYLPSEAIRIGKNKKTSFPFRVDSIRTFNYNVIDANIYTSFIFDANKDNDTVISG